MTARHFRVLDLFSAAAGGWSLGLHRAGFVTVAACEIVEWRRILYSENFPHVRLYDDVRTLNATRLVSDLGFLPDVIVGSPPCQDISSANAKGKGIEGERSGLYIEAVRLVGDCRPRWFAFENSSNLRTRGADRLLDALETLRYACQPCVVGADNVGANHVRKRSWLIGYDPAQLANTRIAVATGWPPSGGRIGCAEGDEGIGPLRPVPQSDPADADGDGRDEGWSGIDVSAADDPRHAPEIGCGTRRPGRFVESVAGSCEPPCGHDADAGKAERRPEIEPSGDRDGQEVEWREGADRHAEPSPPRCDDAADACGVRLRQQREWLGASNTFDAPHDPRDDDGNSPDTDETRQPHGRLESCLRSEEVANDGCGDGRRDDGSRARQMGGSEGAGGHAQEPWPDWNGGLAHHLRLDDGLSAWVADTRIAVGGSRGTSAASLIVEAFGDAVVPQIPEAIGRAILRTEAALNMVLSVRPFGVTTADDETPGDEGAS